MVQFLVMSRVPGARLGAKYMGLSEAQPKSVCVQLARILEYVLSIQHSAIGHLLADTMYTVLDAYDWGRMS